MAHEEHISRFSSRSGSGGGGGGGGTLSKKLKHNKVPQRGMGVAQLEKLIFEERQLKDAGVLIHDPIKFRRPAIPLPPPFPPNRLPLISNSDGMNSDFVHMSSGSGNNCGGLYNFDGVKLNSNQNRNQYSIAISTNQGGLCYESNPLIHQPCSSSMVSSLSKELFYGQNNPERCQMVGLKRSYPFPIENIPIPSFNCKIPSAYVSHLSKTDESTSKNPLSLGYIRDEKTKKLIDENDDLAKDFLTLAPPKPSPPSHSKLKEKLQPLRETNQLSYQGQTRDPEWLDQLALHNFFPAAKTHGTNNYETDEYVDLSLKL
ncbi:hypothetical protein E3N88_34677 [Mikania micrantha]|uniref:SPOROCYTELESS-like EAR-containing protein 1 n=1 Tax=Mikania micrantha TaxID=192012 RepID=A0A5N6LYU2_9ASTR|nr:hypothetical protein E3N88_34677 [Mikania micrantha]